MVRQPDATMQPAPQDNQLMSKHRVLGLKPQLRLERRGQNGQNETEHPDHSASLGDSITASTQTRFSVHTRVPYCFDFFGASFFGLVLVGEPVSSPWQGQASLNASIAMVIPGSFTRSGLLFRYRRRTLALCKTPPCAGGHARTSAGKFGEKSIAVSIIPSHEPADRASP